MEIIQIQVPLPPVLFKLIIVIILITLLVLALRQILKFRNTIGFQCNVALTKDIERLAEKKGITPREVFNKALDFYFFLHDFDENDEENKVLKLLLPILEWELERRTMLRQKSNQNKST